MATPDSPQTQANTKHVVVGCVHWNQRSEQEEIHNLLQRHGIPMYLDGSLLLDILVPLPQADAALSLLRTNHLTTEGKIRVGTP